MAMRGPYPLLRLRVHSFAGTLRLEKGRGTLRLDALGIEGKQTIDVHSLELNLR